ncbi:MAG: hypothetical protein K2Y71_06375 [Xanthobacteraceae bacterium]|nr:hypothetical protein [Xanthobacteraceae bacterium]
MLLGRLVSAVWISILLLSSASAQPPEASNDLVLYFYKDPRPSRLVGFFDAYEKPLSQRNWEAYPPIVGLFAVVFREHPNLIEKLVPTKMSSRAAEALVAALLLSGNQGAAKKLQARFDQAGSDATLRAQLTGLPSRLESIQIRIPTHLDILWGAAFANGESAFVLMILDFYAQTANLSEAVAIDMTQVIPGAKKDPFALLDMRKKYGDTEFVRIVYAGAALWGLLTNAARQEFVEQAIAKYVADHPSTNAGKLLALRSKSKKP